MADVSTKAKSVKLLVLDVDGILTSGQIVIDHKGDEIKFFNVADGFGIVLFHRSGFQTAIISARSSKAVEVRAKDLGIKNVFQNAKNKSETFDALCKKINVKPSEVCFMGDDLPDLGLLKKVGLAVTVPNAVAEVKKAADVVTKSMGGQGAVRETIEMILKAKGKWLSIVKEFSTR